MKFVFFVHSLVSDWNHGNAHFIRGVIADLLERGHTVDVYEPADAWSRDNLVRGHGERPLREFASAFPSLRSNVYERDLDVERALDGADIALVHEWNEPWLVRAVGQSVVPALFHDTHHRAATAPAEMRRYDLTGYAGVLAFGEAIAAIYRERGWHDRVWTWHEAADTRTFRPLRRRVQGDIVWIGNWGDGERARELRTFLLGPVRSLHLGGEVYGVRYPAASVRAVERAGLRYRGWIPNHRAPEAFARHRVTVHVPRRPYVEALPGIPTIRVFEALACGIPLVSAPWEDSEGLFTAERDFLFARTGKEMQERLREVCSDRGLARSLAQTGRRAVLARHTCTHRVDELFQILNRLGIRRLKPAKEREAA
jgi:spore maturation protein CgeB